MSKRSKLKRTVALTVSGAIYAPSSFKLTPIDALLGIVNGCGAADSKFDFIPDRILGTYVGHACNIHDWMYSVGTAIEDKDEADRVMLNNMLRLIERDKSKWYKPTWLQRRIAKGYYEAVKHYGGPAFWAGKS